MAFNQPIGEALGPIAGFLGGSLFGKSPDPFKEARKQYMEMFGQAQQQQQPFYQAGVGALPQLQDWLGQMQDPAGFINQLQSQYTQSPADQFAINQGLRGAQNRGSAAGLIGSTPMAQFQAQTAADIGGQQMNQWLQNVLGINTLYGQGEQNLVNLGQHSADTLSNLLSGGGQDLAGLRYGSAVRQNQNLGNILGGMFGGAQQGLTGFGAGL